MSTFLFLLKVSRPRFWLYVFGPYIVGLAAGAAQTSDILDWRVLFFAAFFLLPANLLIYGVNDIFDFETDRLNEKKQGYETLVDRPQQKHLWSAILAFNLPFLAVAALLIPESAVPLAGFLFFSIFYSAPPIRAKTKPFLDSAFNILYVFPAVLSYKLLSGQYPPLEALIAAGLWTAAMHAYSAIPDIEADKKARLSTIATFCGANITLIICASCYAAAVVLSFKYLSYLSVILGAIYLALMLLSFLSVKRNALFAIYRYFPLINSICGFVLFWYIALNKFSI